MHSKKPFFMLQLINYWCIQAFELLKLDNNNDFYKTASLSLIGTVYKEMRSLCSRSMQDRTLKLGN